MPSKYCSRCQLIKDYSEFWFVKGKPHSYCRECANAYRNQWYRTEKGRDHQHRQAILPTSRYYTAKYAAIKRGLEFSINLVQFREIVSLACVYCGGLLDTTGSSMDRSDNSIGYTPENVVPCCGVCNYVKGDVFTSSEMTLLGGVIHQIRATRPLTIKRGGRPPKAHIAATPPVT